MSQNNAGKSPTPSTVELNVSIISQDGVKTGKKSLIKALKSNQLNIDKQTADNFIVVEDFKNNCFLKLNFIIISSDILTRNSEIDFSQYQGSVDLLPKDMVWAIK